MDTITLDDLIVKVHETVKADPFKLGLFVATTAFAAVLMRHCSSENDVARLIDEARVELETIFAQAEQSNGATVN
jgi:hypothetical protein